ncbi:amidotransferase [compost metagenome]
MHDYSRALLDARQAHLGDEVYQKAVASLASEHQGDLVGEWMLRFIGHSAKARHNAA